MVSFGWDIASNNGKLKKGLLARVDRFIATPQEKSKDNGPDPDWG